MIAKQRRCNPSVFTEKLMDTYAEYRAAVINGDREQAVSLGRELVPAVIDRDVYQTMLQSLGVENPVNAAGTAAAAAPAQEHQDMAAEDLLAIQRALEEGYQ